VDCGILNQSAIDFDLIFIVKGKVDFLRHEIRD